MAAKTNEAGNNFSQVEPLNFSPLRRLLNDLAPSGRANLNGAGFMGPGGTQSKLRLPRRPSERTHLGQ